MRGKKYIYIYDHPGNHQKYTIFQTKNGFCEGTMEAGKGK